MPSAPSIATGGSPPADSTPVPSPASSSAPPGTPASIPRATSATACAPASPPRRFSTASPKFSSCARHATSRSTPCASRSATGRCSATTRRPRSGCDGTASAEPRPWQPWLTAPSGTGFTDAAAQGADRGRHFRNATSQDQCLVSTFGRAWSTWPDGPRGQQPEWGRDIWSCPAFPAMVQNLPFSRRSHPKPAQMVVKMFVH
jgi:hypothetical protein